MERKYIDMIIEQYNMDVEVMDLVKHVHNDVTDVKKSIQRIEKHLEDSSPVNNNAQNCIKPVHVNMGHSLLTMSSRLLTTILSMCAYILNLVMLTVWQRFVPISDKKLQDELIAELDFHYKRIQYVQPIPGKSCPKVDLNKTYSILKMVDREQRDSLRKYGWSDQWMVELKTEDNDLEKIFISSDDAETPRRILIEGEAGIGKTSLCRRLASDWRSKKDYLKDRFKFILLLEGKKYRKGLKEALREQGLISESINCDEMWEYLHNNSEDILWVIDGLDELSISNESEIVKLIKADIFRKSTVIITSRPRDLEDLLGSETSYFDRRIINLGFTQDTATSVIKEYFKSKPHIVKESDLKLFMNNLNIRGLLRNPLMCIILCFLMEEKGLSEIFSNNEINCYQLVVLLSDCVFNRFSAQHKSELTECKDRIRMIAFRGLMQGKQVFTLTEINNIISLNLNDDDVLFQTGLFMKELSVTITGDENDLYIFPHKAIQEALAAQYVYSLTDELERKEAMIEISRSCFPSSVILVYLCVLFTDKNDTDKLKELFNRIVYCFMKPESNSLPIFSSMSVIGSICLECLLVSNFYQYFAKKWSELFTSKKCVLDLNFSYKFSNSKYLPALDRLVKENFFANTVTSVIIYYNNHEHLVSFILSNLQSLKDIMLIEPIGNYMPLIQENVSVFQKVDTDLNSLPLTNTFIDQCIEVFKLLNVSAIKVSIQWGPLQVCLIADKFQYSGIKAPDISSIFNLLNQLLESRIKIGQYSVNETACYKLTETGFINTARPYYESFCHEFLPQFLRFLQNSDSTVTASNDKDFMERFISDLKDKSKDIGIEVTCEESLKGTCGDDMISLYTGKCKWELTFRSL